jgi:RNA polymerase sigma-70 factor (ECF subfamily)
MPPPPSADTDHLLEQAAQGDVDARQQLLGRHRARLRRMVDLRLSPRLAARFDPSDVVQEALAEADRRLADYLRRRPVAFYPWLRGLAWDRLVDLQRRHAGAGRRSIRREEAGVLELPDDSASPSEKLVQAELRQRVRIALDGLPELDREVLVLRHLEQLSTEETAAVLRISSSAVKMRTLRALQRLRLTLGGPAQEQS